MLTDSPTNWSICSLSREEDVLRICSRGMYLRPLRPKVAVAWAGDVLDPFLARTPYNVRYMMTFDVSTLQLWFGRLRDIEFIPFVP